MTVWKWVRCRKCGRLTFGIVLDGKRAMAVHQYSNPCPFEIWRAEGRRRKSYRRAVRSVERRLREVARPGRILRLLRERRRAAGASVPDGLPTRADEAPKLTQEVPL